MASQTLSPAQAKALLDILTHHEAYEEIRDLRYPGVLEHSGPPFKTVNDENRLPLLYALFTKFMVPLPGLRDVSPAFYQDKCQLIVEEFAKADLSESYEVGYIGIRKTLATAMAAMIEGPARGFYGGFSKRGSGKKNDDYDTSNPKDLSDGFHDFLQGFIYGKLGDEVIAQIAKSDKLEEQTRMVQAAHEYILIILASFLHYIFVITPEGQTMLTMLKQVTMLIPWLAVRQTLKIGNVATMVNAMMKIILTKMSINSVTTFLRITNPSDDGWNLLQTIIWTVVNWDSKQLMQRALDIEKSTDAPNKAQLKLIETYVEEKTAEEHSRCRSKSQKDNKPIVKIIMEEYDGGELSDAQNALGLDYLSIKVSLRDRKKIVAILCSRQPDLTTQAVREAVAAYDPIIRALHNAADLSASMGDLQAFLDDLVFFAPSGKNTPAATVSDFVRMLRKHQSSFHRLAHQICKNGPEMIGWYKGYIDDSAQFFRVNESEAQDGGAGKLNNQLNDLITNLPEDQRTQVLAECDAYATYLSDLAAASEADMKFAPATVEPSPKRFMGFMGSRTPTSKPATPGTSRSPSPQRSDPGPGIFLRRWQAYVNETPITPARPHGPVRYGSEHEVIASGRVANIEQVRAAQVKFVVPGGEVKAAPSCARTVEYLAKGFRELLRDIEKGSASVE